MITCQQCHTVYIQSKSTSYLPLTYCCSMCEQISIGWDMKSFINGNYIRVKKEEGTVLTEEIVTDTLERIDKVIDGNNDDDDGGELVCA